MSDINRKRNDTTPITGTLTENGEPSDLSQARAVHFYMRADDADGDLKASGEAEVVDAEAGEVRYSFAADEVDTAGFYVAEWEVEYADYTRYTFPDAGYITVRIGVDLN